MKIQLLSIFITCCLFITSNIYSQEVIATAGCNSENSNGILCWTIGESIIETYENTDQILTQGFHQSNLTVTAVQEDPLIEFEIAAFPNPATDYLNLQVDEFNNLSYQLYDLNGRLLEQNDIQNNKTEISLTNLPSSTYILRVLQKGKELKTFKIIKK